MTIAVIFSPRARTELPMEMTQILPELRKLKRVEKLYIMQVLVSELAQEESELIQPGVSYPIWSPYDAYDAAATMLKVLQESKSESYA